MLVFDTSDSDLSDYIDTSVQGLTIMQHVAVLTYDTPAGGNPLCVASANYVDTQINSALGSVESTLSGV